MKEVPFYFGKPRHKRFGIFHLPDELSKKTAFVFCHPFAEEKLWTHRVYVSLARILAENGYPVLRFDFMGYGDSMGDFADADVESRIDDIKIAIETTFSKVNGITNVSLFGLRFGATLAALTAEISPKVSSLILWQPIIDGERYMQEVLRSNLSTQMAVYGRVEINRKELVEQMKMGKTVEVDGYHLTGKMFNQTKKIKLDQKNFSRLLPALILQLSPKDNTPENKKLQALSSLYSPGHLECVKEDPFWREIRRWYSSAPNAQRRTLKWVEDNCE